MKIERRTIKQRLTRKNLIKYIFMIFSEQYEKSGFETIWDIKIPIENLRNLLKQFYGVDYTSNYYILTLLKRYEKQIGYKLFRFEQQGGSHKNVLISIHNKMSAFYQHINLYASHKIKVANGVYEMMQNYISTQGINRTVNVLLGSGTIPYYIASILAEKSWQEKTRYHVYTHNLGVIEKLKKPKANNANIEIYTPAGRIDTWINVIMGIDNELYLTKEFDFVVQSTKYIYEGMLYVHSPEESELKKIILKQCKGTKILTLIKDEFIDQLPKGLSPFGSLTDYHYMVVPRMNISGRKKRKYDLIFDRYSNFFSPEIIYWGYIIYKIKQDASHNSNLPDSISP